jgi:excisionase family DNA binding protein
MSNDMEQKMSEREQARRTAQSRRDRERNGSFTVTEWCEYRRISRAMFYKLAEQGRAPLTHHAGAKVLISAEADARWLAEREAEAA